MRYLLDTSALLAHARKERGRLRVQALFEEGGSEVLATGVSIAELARRLRDLGATVEEARPTVGAYEEVLDSVVAADARLAWTAFEIGCATPARLPLIDALIAAAARERGACLVHRDRHLAPIPADVVTQLDLSDGSGPG